MSKKISKDEFERRFYKNYPDCNITVLEYTAMANPARVRCNICGKIHNRPVARQFINGFDCCNAHNETRLEKAQRILQDSDTLSYVKQVDRDHIIIKCSKCGNEFKRALNACLDDIEVCSHCGKDNIKDKNMLSKDEVQKRIDEVYGCGQIELLEYNGQLEKNTYKCHRCGMVFKKRQISLIRGTGCPKCDKIVKSRGEEFIDRILCKLGIKYQRQYVIPELSRNLRFDFGILNDSGKLAYLIEVQGDQHFHGVDFYGGDKNYQTQLNRDNKKREFCKKHSIPLYEIRYSKGVLYDLDILPFYSSTTISAKGSTIDLRYWK